VQNEAPTRRGPCKFPFDCDVHHGGRSAHSEMQAFDLAVRAKRGSKPDLLKVRGRWQDATKRSLQKKKPPEGWGK